MIRSGGCRPATAVLAALLGGMPAAAATALDQLGAKLASPSMQAVTDRTLGDYFAGLVTVTEVGAGDCGAAMRISSSGLSVAGSIVALRRVVDCNGPKPILALRLTINEDGADAVRAAMRATLGKPCFDGLGAMGAPSLFWSDERRLLGVVQDTAPARAFSVFFVNQENSGSSDPPAEQALRRALEADMPPSCK